MSVQILAPLLNWPVCLFIVELLWLFIYCAYKAYIRYKTYKYHCTRCGFSFHLLDTVLGSTKVFGLDEILNDQFFTLIAYAFSVRAKKPLFNPRAHRHTLMLLFFLRVL